MTEVAHISFVKWQDLYERERPFALFIDVPADAKDKRTSNLVWEQHELRIHDVRGSEHTYNLDDHGFAFIQHETKFDKFDSAQAVETTFFHECRELLKSQLDEVDEIFFFDWRLRSSARVLRDKVVDLAEPTDKMRPSTQAHIDLSPKSIVDRVRYHLPDRADHLLRGRVRVVNLWRPLNEVQDWPLAVCVGSGVSASDIIQTDHIRRNYVSLARNMKYNPAHQWHFLSCQRRDEVLLMKQLDSDPFVRSKVCPHGSFKLKGAAPDAAPRESVEVRALVFTYPKEK